MQNLFVDIDASKRFAHWKLEVCPTITRSRAASAGFYVTSRQRRLIPEELMKLQGILPKSLRKYSGLPRGVLDAALGNAMSACILERLLPRIVWATGCIPELMPDVWSCPDFIAAGGHFGKRKRNGA